MIRNALRSLLLVALVGGTAVAATDPIDADTLLQQGNAYAGTGQRGRAILAYERGLVLAPRDTAIATNLAHTRENAGIAVEEPSRVDHAVGLLGEDTWSWIAFGGAALMCLGLVGIAWGVRRARPAAFGGVVVAVAGAMAAHLAAVPESRAVIVTADTARIAPFATADAAFSAPEGETVDIERRRGDFVYVHDGDRSGWLPKAAVESVLPGS